MSQQRIEEHRIDIRYVLLDEIDDAQVFDEYRSLLSSDELERLQRITNSESRRLFLTGRGLLRKTLSQCSGIDPRSLEFQYNTYGKPSLKTQIEPSLEFSVSHTRGIAMCAVASDSPLGVDVEHDRRVENPLEIARRFFAPAEAEELERLSAEQRGGAFLDLWTLRESFVKARGVSLFTRPADYAFSLTTDGDVRVAFSKSSGEKPEDWQFFRFRLAQGYRAALAVARPAMEKIDISIHQGGRKSAEERT